MLLLFCHNGPLCGDGRGEICVPAACRLCSDSQGNFPKKRRAPAVWEKGSGTGPGWS